MASWSCFFRPSGTPGQEKGISEWIAGRIQERPLPSFYAEWVWQGIPALILPNDLLDWFHVVMEQPT